MDKVPLNIKEITLGVPLMWSIYAKDGKIYFHEGYIFTNENSLRRLANMQLFRDPTGKVINSASGAEADKTTVSVTNYYEHNKSSRNNSIFEQVGELIQKLEQCYRSIREDSDGEVIEQIKDICQKIKQLNNQDENKTLGAIHFYRNKDVLELLPVFSMILCEIVSRDLGLTESKIDNLLMAAATVYVGCTRAGEHIKFDSQLSERLLRQQGIIDNEWLDIILLYEKAEKLAESKVELESLQEISILNVVKGYLSLVLPVNGKIMSPRLALQTIFKQAKSHNEKVYIFMIKQIGIYPPGSFVKLENGEIGFIVSRDKQNTLNVFIKCYKDKRNIWYSKPVIRDGKQAEYAINAVYEETRLGTEDIIKLWES